MNFLYHKSIFWPNDVDVPSGTDVLVNVSNHARQRASQRGCELPVNLSFDSEDIFEMELDESDTVTKIMVRQRYDATNDLVMALIPQGESAKLKTAWLNNRRDQHRSLNTNKYMRS